MLKLRNPERCPKCAGDSKVINSRMAEVHRYRRRECIIVTCAYRWTTYESFINPENIRLKRVTS